MYAASIEVLAKIDEYEEYCRTHESCPNNRAGTAISRFFACGHIFKDSLGL